MSVPHGHQAANVNLLTSKDEIDPVTGMARYSGIPVTIHPASDSTTRDVGGHRSSTTAR